MRLSTARAQADVNHLPTLVNYPIRAPILFQRVVLSVSAWHAKSYVCCESNRPFVIRRTRQQDRKTLGIEAPPSTSQVMSSSRILSLLPLEQLSWASIAAIVFIGLPVLLVVGNVIRQKVRLFFLFGRRLC